jgi:hypothetical protein
MYLSYSQVGEVHVMYLSCSAGSILSGSAASMICCHELVDPGITKPNWNSHSAHAGEGRGRGKKESLNIGMTKGTEVLRPGMVCS